MLKDAARKRSGKTNAPGQDPAKGERIAKALARAGIASRREAERMIEAGRVSVNGKVLDTPAFLVTPKDNILVDKQPIAAKEPARLWRYHKPDGLLTTHNDPGGRATVFDALPQSMPRVISVGRLDMTSEGLLLLTNDGELARQLELPSTGWARRYRARAFGKTTQAQLDTLMKGVKIDGIPTGPIEATLDREQGGNVWVSVTIREGKNREVRRAFETLNLRVNRLIRISYGPFQLGDLAKGASEEVPNRILRDQVGHLTEIEATRPEGQLKIRAPKGGQKHGLKGTRKQRGLGKAGGQKKLPNQKKNNEKWPGGVPPKKEGEISKPKHKSKTGKPNANRRR